MSKRRKKLASKGILYALSFAFMASALLRVASAADTTDVSDAPAVDVAESDIKTCVDEVEMNTLLQSLLAREATVEEDEVRIKKSWVAIEESRAELEEQITYLEELETRLESKMAVSQNASEDDLSKLTAVYESMKPKDSAALFATMTPEFSAGFLARMRPDTAAAILTNLEPELAYSISVVLAGRNANAPTQ